MSVEWRNTADARAFEVCSVDREALELAEAMQGSDFEDNLQVAVAVGAGLDLIITRNKDDFEESPILILSPAELLAHIA